MELVKNKLFIKIALFFFYINLSVLVIISLIYLTAHFLRKILIVCAVFSEENFVILDFLHLYFFSYSWAWTVLWLLSFFLTVLLWRCRGLT